MKTCLNSETDRRCEQNSMNALLQRLPFVRLIDLWHSMFRRGRQPMSAWRVLDGLKALSRHHRLPDLRVRKSEGRWLALVEENRCPSGCEYNLSPRSWPLLLFGQQPAFQKTALVGSSMIDRFPGGSTRLTEMPSACQSSSARSRENFAA